MPTAPPSRCHCGAIATQQGRCPAHQRKPWANPSKRNQLLNRWTWQKTARAYLEEHPRCARCGQPATDVDHIVPVAAGGALYEDANLQALCLRHHQEKSRADAARLRARRTKGVSI